jgi:hypothetical protein
LPPPPAAGIAAARWVPARPAYVFASPAVADAQRGARELIDLLGVAAGYDVGDAVRSATSVLGVDPLHGDPITQIGVDPQGSWAMFSEDLSPTIVVHLAAPGLMTAFLDQQRARGLVTQSVIVDQTEVVSARLFGGLAISWAIAGDWMWIHLSPGAAIDVGTAWFTASHTPHAAAWAADWSWAQRAAGAAAGVVGFLDLRGAVARAVAQLPAAVACGHALASVGRVAVALESDDRHVEARLALDVGPTDALARAILPPPSGWGALAARAAIAAQWNLDLGAARAWLAPCAAAAGASLDALDDTGIRAARGVLLDFDPDALSGSGAIAFDLRDARYLEHQLDRIPLRRTLERDRTFGARKGHSIEIPFSVTVDYVLERELAVAALGDGVLAKLLAPGPSSVAPVFALDVAPPAMSAAAWETVVTSLARRELSGSAGPATRRIVERLMRWRDGHLGVTLGRSELVLTISGHRR